MRKKGIALPTTLVFLLILMTFALWITTQIRNEIRISAALKQYEEAFNLADGACDIAIKYLLHKTPRKDNWNPQLEGKCVFPTQDQSIFNQYHEEGKFQFQPVILWKGYDTRPLPGWMLNWQGYSSFHRVHYKTEGRVKSSQNESNISRVSAIILKIIR